MNKQSFNKTYIDTMILPFLIVGLMAFVFGLHHFMYPDYSSCEHFTYPEYCSDTINQYMTIFVAGGMLMIIISIVMSILLYRKLRNGIP